MRVLAGGASRRYMARVATQKSRRLVRRDSLLWVKLVAQVLELGRPKDARGRECGFSLGKSPAAASEAL